MVQEVAAVAVAAAVVEVPATTALPVDRPQAAEAAAERTVLAAEVEAAAETACTVEGTAARVVQESTPTVVDAVTGPTRYCDDVRR